MDSLIKHMIKYRLNNSCTREKYMHVALFIKNNFDIDNSIIGLNGRHDQIHGTVHAEIDALNKLNKVKTIYKYKTVDLIVIRVSKTGAIGMSRPCHHCINKLRKTCIQMGIKIRTVFYSENNRNLTKMKFDDLYHSDYIHISSGYKCKHSAS